ncbi:MAG: Rne/Rng family ribonuclease [Pseudomonadota bacterium]|nr:Rne/Rng family ribonuclease [Pseudomonadota bacterium]
MSKKMLIDASRSDETRVVVMVDGRIEEIDHETADRRPIKSNIYLARVTRVEPSLQAAFVDYGGNRHGFLPFSEIHPDYYQLPVADREALLREVEDKVEERRQRFLNHRANPRRGGRGRGGRSSDAAVAVDPEGDQPHVDFPVDQNGDFIAPEAMTADNLRVGGDDAADGAAADAAADTDAAPVEAEAEAGADEATVSLTEAAADAATGAADTGDAENDAGEEGDEPAKTATAATGTEDDKVVSDDAVTLGDAARDLPQGDDEDDGGDDDVASEQLEAEASADTHEGDDRSVDGEGGIEELPERDLVIEEAGASGGDDDSDDDDGDGAEASEDADASAEGDDDEDEEGGKKPRSRRRRRSRRGRKGGSGDDDSAEGGKSARGRSGRDDEDDDDQDDNDDDIDQDDDDEDMFDEDAERRSIMHSIISRRYSIQEVIKRRQVMLVQVTKEERGNKGAALSSYLSLAGRYSVYMPNTTRGGGISRKISSPKDRRRLKTILDDLDLPQDISIIVRTAGSQRTKAEIKRDYEYLRRTWDGIRETTLNSMAPSLIYEEANVMKRAIRDMYSSDMEEVLVEGDEGYKDAKSFMKTLTPSHAKRVQQFKNEGTSLFQRHKAEQQLDALFNPVVTLKSGGYLVLNQTEALVAVDVNSGKATRERSIEETALATNLEAAEEVARQLRLRDLAGLVVIDFIDMDESRHRGQVERRLKESMRGDRARIQLGRISPFGLLELSRQRIRPSVFDTIMVGCPVCGGIGVVRSSGSLASSIMRRIGDLLLERDNLDRIEIDAPTDAALKVLNDHREELAHLETQHGVKIAVLPNAHLHSPHFHLRVYTEDKVETFEEGYTADPTAPKKDRRRGRRGGRSEDRDKDRNRDGEEGGSRHGRRGRGRGSRGEGEDEGDPRASDDIDDRTDGEDGDGEGGSRRQRGKRGGRRRGKRDSDGEASASSDTGSDDSGDESDRPEAEAGEDGDKPKRRRGKRGGRNRRKSRSEDEAGDNPDAVNEATDAAAEPAANAEATSTEDVPAADAESDTEDKPKPRKRTRSKAKAEAEPEADAGAAESGTDDEAAPAEVSDEEEKPKKRTRAPRKSAAKSDAKSEAKSEEKADEKVDDKAEDKDEPAADTKAEASGDEGGSARPVTLAVEPDTPKKEGPRRRGWWSRGK